MKAVDIIYGEIYRGSLKAGATERASFDAAVTGVEDYKKNKFKKAADLINKKITEAKRMGKAQKTPPKRG